MQFSVTTKVMKAPGWWNLLFCTIHTGDKAKEQDPKGHFPDREEAFPGGCRRTSLSFELRKMPLRILLLGLGTPMNGAD
jgi:hypothetical protein